MKIAISGASGYLGKSLISAFQQVYEIVIVPRGILFDDQLLKSRIKDCDAIIVLNGYPIIKRWTRRNKARIVESRLKSINAIENCIATNDLNIKTVITASAIGGYDNYDFNTEDSKLADNGFVSELITKWETISLEKARTVQLRIGVVIGNGSGFIKNITLNMRMGLSVIFGSAVVSLSYITIENFIAGVQFILKNDMISGTVNLVEPVCNSQFVLYKKLKKQNIVLPCPAFALKLVFGKAAVLLYDGQKVIPEKLLKSGFKFNSVDLKSIFAG